jgi:hypothetical protein
MSKLLFITQDFTLQNRIREQSGTKSVIAASLIHGAELITDQQSDFKAIYFDPNDTSYSALALLELSLSHRPATPIFLIDSESEFQTDESHAFLKKHHIRGIIDMNHHFADIESFCSIRNSSPVVPIRRTTIRSNHSGYLAVPSTDFIHQESFPFDVFIEDDRGELALYATAGSTIKPKLIEAIGHMVQFHIREANIIEIHERIQQTRRDMEYVTGFPTSWKAAETLYKAKTLLQNLQTHQLSDSAVNDTHSLLCEIFHLVTQLQATKDQSKLERFIDQAQSCDRNIACATLSILMCKNLKYERNAIVEILGIASLFQDISLYNSPFGNLSMIDIKKMTPEQHSYYLQHPTLSADLLAENTSIPEVTLQVIRQHHERKDRTGFPLKVGGMRLHPMAEVLSLINEVIDKAPQSLEAENEIYRHYSDPIVLSYKGIQFRSKDSKLKAA